MASNGEYAGRSSSAASSRGAFLAIGAHLVRVEVSDAIWIQIGVSVVGIFLLMQLLLPLMIKKVDKPRLASLPQSGSVADDRTSGRHGDRHRARGSARRHVGNQLVPLPDLTEGGLQLDRPSLARNLSFVDISSGQRNVTARDRFLRLHSWEVERRDGCTHVLDWSHADRCY